MARGTEKNTKEKWRVAWLLQVSPVIKSVYSLHMNPSSHTCQLYKVPGPEFRTLASLRSHWQIQFLCISGLHCDDLTPIDIMERLPNMRIASQLALCVCVFNAPVLHGEGMAPHSRTLAWRLPWTEEPGKPQSVGLLRVQQDWSTSLSVFTFMHWRWKWQPTPVFLPGESQGQGRLVGCVYGVTQSRTRLKWLGSSSSMLVLESKVESVPCLPWEFLWDDCFLP